MGGHHSCREAPLFMDCSELGAFRTNPQQEELEKLEEAFLLMFETQLWDDDKVRVEIFSLRHKLQDAEARGAEAEVCGIK